MSRVETRTETMPRRADARRGIRRDHRALRVVPWTGADPIARHLDRELERLKAHLRDTPAGFVFHRQQPFFPEPIRGRRIMRLQIEVVVSLGHPFANHATAAAEIAHAMLLPLERAEAALTAGGEKAEAGESRDKDTFLHSLGAWRKPILSESPQSDNPNREPPNVERRSRRMDGPSGAA